MWKLLCKSDPTEGQNLEANFRSNLLYTLICLVRFTFEIHPNCYAAKKGRKRKHLEKDKALHKSQNNLKNKSNLNRPRMFKWQKQNERFFLGRSPLFSSFRYFRMGSCELTLFLFCAAAKETRNTEFHISIWTQTYCFIKEDEDETENQNLSRVVMGTTNKMTPPRKKEQNRFFFFPRKQVVAPVDFVCKIRGNAECGELPRPDFNNHHCSLSMPQKSQLQKRQALRISCLAVAWTQSASWLDFAELIICLLTADQVGKARLKRMHFWGLKKTAAPHPRKLAPSLMAAGWRRPIVVSLWHSRGKLTYLGSVFVYAFNMCGKHWSGGLDLN